ncbi:hypothetical protein EVAR_45052_1 [Eumeta japonica]|uniref:Uncharacterized protein n=1 Tax=Eumeta variegata TaxID=151549 RepID=A0A4C1ZCP7_EUMVA|nr:hypothetical protein EVAR_45052_1 [Eumeta japonica]
MRDRKQLLIYLGILASAGYIEKCQEANAPAATNPLSVRAAPAHSGQSTRARSGPYLVWDRRNSVRIMAGRSSPGRADSGSNSCVVFAIPLFGYLGRMAVLCLLHDLIVRLLDV